MVKRDPRLKYAQLLITSPLRAWSWGQCYPDRAIFYGLVLLGGAFISKLVLVAIGSAAIISGLVATFRPE